MILAADIGGSKTAICVFDKKGNLIKKIKTDGIGVASLKCENTEALEEVLLEVSNACEIESVAVNLGGKNKEQTEEIFKKFFPKAPVSVYRESEGAAALELSKSYGAQIVVLAGTGVIASAKTKDNCFVIGGGWGANIGDSGSGYDIGLRLIQKTLCELDGNNPLSDVAKRVSGLENYLQKTDSAEEFCRLRDVVRQNIGPFDRRQIASFAKVAAEYGRSGDEECKKIFEDAGHSIGNLVLNTAQKAGYHRLGGVLVLGGLVNTVDLWGKSFEKTVISKIETDNFYYKEDGIIMGVYEIALKQIV